VIGTLLRRITVHTLNHVVERGKASERAPVRVAAEGLDRVRKFVGLDRIDVRLEVPQWDGGTPDQPMWQTDKEKLRKWQLDRGIIKPEKQAEAAPLKPVLTIYYRRGCPYCRAALGLVQEQNLLAETIDYTDNDDLRKSIRTRSGQRTTPHIFVRDVFIGGFNELSQLHESGKLAKLLADPKLEVPAHGRDPSFDPNADEDDDDDDAPPAPVAKPAAKPLLTIKKPPKKLPVIHPERSPFEALLDETADANAERLEGDALIARVREVLDECRPLVQADGGDIELLDIQDDTVGVKLTGNCIGCPSSQATLKQGIERKLKQKIPQLKGIRSPQLAPAG
jgi:Fe-S cluster biogenesis protein NfuA/glutaredoxin